MQNLKPKSYKDRIVKARKPRHCTSCGGSILPGKDYLDFDPPHRLNGYFAMCLPCAIVRGYVE